MIKGGVVNGGGDFTPSVSWSVLYGLQSESEGGEFSVTLLKTVMRLFVETF